MKVAPRYKLLTLFVITVYTNHPALHCQNSIMYAYIHC